MEAVFGILGAIDDYLKIKLKNSSGINAKLKFFGQFVIALVTILILVYFTGPFGLVLYWLVRIFYSKKLAFHD